MGEGLRPGAAVVGRTESPRGGWRWEGVGSVPRTGRGSAWRTGEGGGGSGGPGEDEGQAGGLRGGSRGGRVCRAEGAGAGSRRPEVGGWSLGEGLERNPGSAGEDGEGEGGRGEGLSASRVHVLLGPSGPVLGGEGSVEEVFALLRVRSSAVGAPAGTRCWGTGGALKMLVATQARDPGWPT